MRLSHDLVVIAGTHLLFFADDAERARAFFRDVLGFENVDSGGGWLIFALPPSELGIHPVNRPDHVSGRLELWFMCNDLARTMGELKAKGVTFEGAISEESFGSYALDRDVPRLSGEPLLPRTHMRILLEREAAFVGYVCVRVERDVRDRHRVADDPVASVEVTIEGAQGTIARRG
jgi:catechol 2,3-dioxygenase-like lactoylglutathione lyase family enzyme